LRPVIPSEEEFPYTIRIVSETFSSNGSSSQASVCASSLALHDAGVPVKSHVAGIAIGLMSDNKGNYKILTDIQGPEDHFGDMDFKVAGTRDGVTAVQMDVKLEGVTMQILKDAFVAAKNAREKILDVLEDEIAKPRKSINPNAPRVEVIKINPDKIGLVIGSGGKTINNIKENYGADDINIEPDGTVYITGKGESAKNTKEYIENMTKDFEVGQIYKGKVSRIENYGAFVKLNDHTEGLVHISELSPERVESIDKLLKIGDIVPVKLKEIDEKGRLNLSIKDADPNFFKL